MAWFSVLISTLMILSLSATHTSSISIQFPNPSFQTESIASLSGDAHFTGDENAVQLNRPTPSSFGVMFTNKPFNFSSSTSLSTHFTFQIGNNVALVIIPSKLVTNVSLELMNANRLLGVQFYPNVCTISFSRVSNVSRFSNVLKDGVKLSGWVDYRAVLKRLDVRLTKLGDVKPVEPLISYKIDLGEILKGEEVVLGLASWNENRERSAFVYSWRSEVKDVPKWMHSIPVNPKEHSTVEVSKENGSNVLGFVFATGCGALVGLVMFFVWSYFVDWQKDRQEGSVRGVGFGYEKIDVVEVKNSETAMK